MLARPVLKLGSVRAWLSWSSGKDSAWALHELRNSGVDVRGLTTMPPLATDPEGSRPYFRELRLLAGEHGLAELSMGTSQDWRVAVEEGATLIRVGSTLFR